MIEYKILIASAISQSCFYQDDKIVETKANEFKYFMALLYLYRKNLLDQNAGDKVFIEDGEVLTTKKKKKLKINPEFENFTVNIEMGEFNTMDVVKNNDYKLLKGYLEDKLYCQHIEVDILGTKKLVDNTRIDIIDTISIEDNILEIKFTNEFVKMVIHNELYYMEVDLKNIFELKSYKAQKLYLLVKDYSSDPKKYVNVNKIQLEMIIGKMPNKTPLANLCKTISSKTDMKISIGDGVGNKLKKYKISFGNISSNTSSNKSQGKPKPKAKDIELWKEAQSETKAWIEKGNIVNNKVAYATKIYNDKVKEEEKKPNPDELKEAKDILDNSDIMDFKNILESEYNNHIGMKDYKLYFVFDESKPTITKNAIETVKVLGSLESKYQ